MRRRSPRSLPPLALTYHGLGDIPLRRDPHHMFVRPRDFVRQVELLRSWGYDLLTFGELARRVQDDGGAGAAALTFDDGFVDNLEVLLPLLLRTGARATVFVVTGWLGQAHEHASWTRLMTASEVAELHRAGVEIGAHTVTHPDLTALDYAHVREELARSKSDLEQITGGTIEGAAYPFGRANEETRRACREAGLAFACRTLGEGSWADAFDLPRQAMENNASLLGLRLKRDGRYEPLMRFLPARAARRLSRQIRSRAVGGRSSDVAA